MKNRDGYEVEVAPIEKVEFTDDGTCHITRGEPGWGTFSISADELDGFRPQVGDAVVVYSQGFSKIRGIAIDGRVFRYRTPTQAEADHEQWKKNYRLEQLERYIADGDALKARADALPLPLRLRMARFAAEGGVEFWIEDAGYEMYALEGCAALLRKVAKLGYINSVDAPADGPDAAGAVQWINGWWEINSAKYNYDYKRQMEMVPDFGDGHSGNTAGAAYSFAIHLLEGGEL